MVFWKKSEKDKQREKIQEESRKALASGGIPVIAEERIKKHIASGSKFFSSDLTTREFLLAKDQNLIPISQVMGTSFFNINFWSSMFRVRLSTGEMKPVSQALLDARRLAVQRLKKEAELLGASGVIGVKVQAGSRTWSSSLREFTAVGTAVKIPGWKHDTFVCDLSGQEFWQLYTAGFRPVDIAFGVCSYYMRQDRKTYNQMYQWWGATNFRNQEIELFTQGFYNSRSIALGRLEKDLMDSLADGVVGTEIDYDFERIETSDNNTAWDLIIHMTALGSGIVEDPELTHEPIPKPKFCINLRDKKLASPKPSRMKELDSKSYDDVESMEEFLEMMSNTRE